MKLLDLTEAYCRHVQTGNSWSDYEQLYPAIFRHYFRFWAKHIYPNIELPIEALHERSKLIRRRLPQILHKFTSHGFDAENFTVVLFVGKGCTNGHAMLDGDRWLVWIPLETYTTTRLVDVFVTHEIAHALHYSHSPGFYFETKGEQRHFSRQLLTEGIATYLTTKVLECSDNSALWGGYLNSGQLRSWRSGCNTHWQELLRYAIRHFDSEKNVELFQGNDPTDVFRFRAGYLIGLNLIRALVAERQITAMELISMSRSKLEKYARTRLIRAVQSN